MTTRTSTKAKKAYEKDLEICKSIDELQWIYTDFAQDATLTCDDLLSLIRNCKERKANFAKAGDKYHMARRPACRK